MDDSRPDILIELAEEVRREPALEHQIHLVLENDHNAAHYLRRDAEYRPQWYVAQWNDDIHHVLHVLLTGESGGYYADYADKPMDHLRRCLAEGFAYQGEASPYRGGQHRGEPTRGLPPGTFVSFLQNHDQVGNRAFGERITALASEEAVHAATAVLLLAPFPPLLFMGEEWGALEPFPFFCDFEPELAPRVTDGRRREFAGFPEFADPHAREGIPDPSADATFRSAVLDWSRLQQSEHQQWLQLHRELLAVRHREITPRLRGLHTADAHTALLGDRGLRAQWTLADGARLELMTNLGSRHIRGVDAPAGRLLYATDDALPTELCQGLLRKWSAVWFLQEHE